MKKYFLKENFKMENEITYLRGFLMSVDAKLSNERFVQNARPEIIENERNKKINTENRIKELTNGKIY